MFNVDNSTRSKDYREILEIAHGDVFISRITASGITANSLALIDQLACSGNKVRILIMSQAWADDNSSHFQFIESPGSEAWSSIRKILFLRNDNIEIRTYSFFMPFVVTGFKDDDGGTMVYEVVDYLEGSTSPRAKAYAGISPNFEIIKSKFEFYWDKSVPVKS